MSGVEWTIVTVVGVCLILLFVILEIFFPPQEGSDNTMVEEPAHDRQPLVRSVGSHTLE